MGRHRKRYTEIERTQEMPVWTDESDAPGPEWGTYTVLGPYTPRRVSVALPVPYARRNAHKGSHYPRPGRDLKRWASSMWRQAGEFLVGAFQPIRDAI